MKEYYTLLITPELEFHHQMQFSVIFRTQLFGGGGVLSLSKRYSQHIISSTEDAIFNLFLRIPF